jgi:glycosyltransferase involved in cell wall biosynthesis
MRLLTITHYADLLGANRSLLHLLEGLRSEKGVCVEVWCPQEGAFTAALRERGFEYKILPFANWGYTLRSFGLWVFPLKWAISQRKIPLFEAELQRFQPDLIHSNSSLVSLGAILAERTGLPHVWHIREFGWSDYQVVFPLGKAFQVKYYQKASAIIAISDCIRTAFRTGLETLVTSEKPPVFTIFNGIGKTADLKALQQKSNLDFAQSELDFIKKTINFLIIGLLHPSKNQLQALRAFRLAFSENPNLRLNIVGSGRKIYTLRLKFLAKIWGLAQAVTFTGYVKNPDAAYANADVVLMCSANEGMGRVTAEAMAQQKTVIGCNSGATPELISDGENGFLYDGSDADLCKKMLFAAENPEKRQEIGAKAFQSVLQNFTDEMYVESVWQVFQMVLKKP